MIKISAIIPTFNRGKTVCRAIESVLNQQKRPIELIVVDDGSTDNTREYLSRFGNAIRVIYQKNRGVSAARNLGVQEAHCEWVAFLDSDDLWMPTHLKSIDHAIKATRGAADLYFSDAIMSSNTDGKSFFEQINFKLSGSIVLTNNGIEWAFRDFHQPMLIPCCVFRRETFLSIGGFNEELPTREDTHIFFLFGIKKVLCAVSNIGSFIKGNNRTSSSLTQQFAAGSIVYDRSTILLYSDILSESEGISCCWRTELKYRLSDAYWRLGRNLFKKGLLYKSCRPFMRSFTTCPVAFLSHFRDPQKLF